MNTYIKTLSDGGNTEGIGALAQYQIACYVLAKLCNYSFYFEGFKNMWHFQYFDITQNEWDIAINQFFNFPTSKFDLPIVEYPLDDTLQNFIIKNPNKIINISPYYAMKYMDSCIDNSSARNCLKELKDNIQCDTTFLVKDSINVCLHLRRFTSTDCDNGIQREYYNPNIESRVNYYKNIIETTSKLLDGRDVHFHIYSQGDVSEFDIMKSWTKNIHFHIDESPFTSIYDMMNCEIFFTANSAMSNIAHMLGNHLVCFGRTTSYHKMKKETLMIDEFGNFDTNQFINRINLR